MKKPNGFDTVQGYGEFEPLELGGHVCKIMQVEEKKSAKGADMLVISLDIAEGKQVNYYSEQYKNDTRDTKKWGCVVYQLVLDNEGNTNKGFKTFIDNVEKSNSGFKVSWGDNFEAQFKGKLIGGVFGREQYQNNNNELKFATKCMFFKSLDAIKKGVDVPQDKLLGGQFAAQTPTANEDDDLPF